VTASVTISQPLELQVTTYTLDSSTANSIAAVSASGGTSPYTYSWANSATTDTIKNLTAGTYTCTIQDANNCTATATVTIVPTGINNITDNSGQITVYPNPNNGVFTVVCCAVRQLADQVSQPIIEVYNMLGEKVLTETLRSAQGDNTIDLTNQPDGIYLYRVITQDGGFVGEGKLVIHK